jgi:anti-sigma B factor antagonist
MTTQFHLETTEIRDGTAVITAAGDLDLITAPELYQHGASALERTPNLILELSRVGFCDSSGFNALLRLRRRALESGGRVVLAAPPEQVRRLLVLAAADSVFAIYDSLAEARDEQLGTT